MKRLLRDNSLSLVMFGLFALFLVGQSMTGSAVYNDDQREHGEAAIGYAEYLRTGHFVEATFENWESEFLQMGAYVLLTVFLFQQGSAESKEPDEHGAGRRGPAASCESTRRALAGAPRRAGAHALRALARRSRSSLLFLVSFVLHALGGAARVQRRSSSAHGRPGRLDAGELPAHSRSSGSSRSRTGRASSWRSASIVVLSIFLRQRGSPESKPVAAPHAETGSS